MRVSNSKSCSLFENTSLNEGWPNKRTVQYYFQSVLRSLGTSVFFSLPGWTRMFVMNRLTNLWCRLKNIKFTRSNYQTDSSETSLLFTTKVSSARQFTNHIKLLPTFSDESLDSQMKKKTVKNPPLTISIVYFLQARLFTIHPGIRTGTMGCHSSPLNFLRF